MEIRRVAVAIDGSEASRKALGLALRLGGPYKPRYVLLSVASMRPEFARYPAEAKPLIDRLREKAEKSLEDSAAAVSRAGHRSESVLLEGYPADEICRYVEREAPDLLFLGRRGLSGQHVHLMGSVSYNVAHFSDSPVLIVQEDQPVGKVLLALDGSEASATASEWAREIAVAHGASVTLLYVVPQKTDEVKFSVSRGIGEPFLGPLARGLKDRGVTVERRVEYGHPAKVIVQAAEKGGHDLLVLGKRGQGGSSLFSLGGVTDKVLHYAPCNTLVAR